MEITGMVGDARNGETWLKWLKIAGNGWKWLEMAGMTGNGWKWLE